MNRETPWLREQLVVAMRQAGPALLSTDELAAVLPPQAKREVCRRPEDCGQYRWPHPAITNFACDGQWHTFDLARSSIEAYRHLRALENQGFCLRVRFDGYRRVYWRLTEPSSATAEIAALEELFSSSPSN